MPGRRVRAAEGEARCAAPTPAGPCERPAGYATAHPGAGPCLRHGGRAPGAPLASAPVSSRNGVRPAEDPLALVGAVLALAKRARIGFRDAWTLAYDAALSYRAVADARELADVLDSTREAWEAAYLRRPSRLSHLIR